MCTPHWLNHPRLRLRRRILLLLRWGMGSVHFQNGIPAQVVRDISQRESACVRPGRVSILQRMAIATCPESDIRAGVCRAECLRNLWSCHLLRDGRSATQIDTAAGETEGCEERVQREGQGGGAGRLVWATATRNTLYIHAYSFHCEGGSLLSLLSLSLSSPLRLSARALPIRYRVPENESTKYMCIYTVTCGT